MGLLNTAVTMLCHRKNRGGARQASQIKYLVYHYTGNDGDHAAANAKYYRDTVVQASAHYFVDDTDVYRSVPDLEIAWAVGGKKWADCSRTGGGTLYGVVTNSNSISIEMCDTVHDGQIMATERTLGKAAALGRELMAKYNIPPERVVRHFDVTGKHCPAYFMASAAWEAFKARLVPQEKPWYTEAMEWAKDAELMDGTRPLENITRAEVATIVRRLCCMLEEDKRQR